MNVPNSELHRLDLAANGSISTEHPDGDVKDCGFVDYVARDWAGENVPRPSRWVFERSVGEDQAVVWFGTRLPDVEPAATPAVDGEPDHDALIALGWTPPAGS